MVLQVLFKLGIESWAACDYKTKEMKTLTQEMDDVRS